MIHDQVLVRGRPVVDTLQQSSCGSRLKLDASCSWLQHKIHKHQSRFDMLIHKQFSLHTACTQLPRKLESGLATFSNL